MLVSLNELPAHQTTGTKALTNITIFLNCFAKHPEATLEYKGSGMILYINIGASFLSVTEGRS